MKTFVSSFFSILVVATLAACGGGGGDNENIFSSPTVANSTSARIVSLYGDSLTVGAAGTGYLEVTPGKRLQEFVGSRYQVEVRGVAGAVVRQALLSDKPNWGWDPFAQQIAKDKTSIAIIRFGGADAIEGTTVDSFRADLTTMVDQAKAAGVKVYLVGIIACQDYVERAAQMDSIVREVAAAEGVVYIYLRDLPFNPTVDLAPGDTVHPSQDYSDRIMERIASYLI